MNRLALMCGGVSAMLTLVWHFAHGRQLLYAAYMACCSMFAVALIARVAMVASSKVLAAFLREQQALRQQAAQLDNAENVTESDEK